MGGISGRRDMRDARILSGGPIDSGRAAQAGTAIFGRIMGLRAGNLPFDCAQGRAKLDFWAENEDLGVESGHVVK